MLLFFLIKSFFVTDNEWLYVFIAFLLYQLLYSINIFSNFQMYSPISLGKFLLPTELIWKKNVLNNVKNEE